MGEEEGLEVFLALGRFGLLSRLARWAEESLGGRRSEVGAADGQICFFCALAEKRSHKHDGTA